MRVLRESQDLIPTKKEQAETKRSLQKQKEVLERKYTTARVKIKYSG